MSNFRLALSTLTLTDEIVAQIRAIIIEHQAHTGTYPTVDEIIRKLLQPG